MIGEEVQIHHVWRMFFCRILCLSCLALSLIYLNLKHRMHILAIECFYPKVTFPYIPSIGLPSMLDLRGSASRW